MAVEVYEVIDVEAPERRAAKLGTHRLLDMTMERYFGREFEAALALFEQVRAKDPEDVVPGLFAKRCSHYLKMPPPDNWQGFEKLNSK